jgi:hypothetical protein
VYKLGYSWAGAEEQREKIEFFLSTHKIEYLGI